MTILCTCSCAGPEPHGIGRNQLTNGRDFFRYLFEAVTYPNGRVVVSDYGTAGQSNDAVSRLAALTDGVVQARTAIR